MPRKSKETAPQRDRTRPWLLALLAAGLLGGAWLLARTPIILTRVVHNGEFRVTNDPLLEDPPEHPRLQLLRRREKLDQVVAPGKTEFEKILLLRRWTRGLWPADQSSFYYPAWDAVEIIDLARRHRNHGFCAQYSIVFLQALAAMGIHARYINLGHFVVGVWSNDHNRWVVMDPTQDVHFERDGRPMRGIEMCEAAWKGNVRRVFKVGSDGSRAPATPDDVRAYRSYSFLKKNDQLTDPPLIKRNGELMRLTLMSDYRDYPKVGRDDIDYGNEFLSWQVSPEQKLLTGARFSQDIDNFRDSYNQCVVLVIRKIPKRALVKVKLIKEQIPDFLRYELDLNGTPASTDRNEGVVNLRPGRNVFKVRARTRSGWLGPQSVVEFYYKPGWLS